MLHIIAERHAWGVVGTALELCQSPLGANVLAIKIAGICPSPVVRRRAHVLAERHACGAGAGFELFS